MIFSIKENFNQPSLIIPVQTVSYIQSQSPRLSNNRSHSQSPILNCNLDRCSSPPHLIKSNLISENSRIKKVQKNKNFHFKWNH